MTAVGSYQAKARLPELLRRVSRGERVVITHHGVPIAALAPIEPRLAQSPQQVIAALKAFRQGCNLGGLSIRELISEGRTPDPRPPLDTT